MEHRRPTSSLAAWLVVLMTAVLWPLAPASSTRAAAPIPLSAFGTATIDGRMPYGEWDGAARMTIPVSLPYPTNPIKVPAEFLVMNDAENLYLALRVGRTLDYAGLSVEFDNDDDGSFMEEGDDGVGASGGHDDSRFFDFARIHCINAGLGDVAGCGPEDTYTDELYPLPGTIDGGSASSQPFGTDFIELFHPLDSADNTRDFSLGPGSSVGFEVMIQLIDPEYGVPCVSTSCGSDTHARGRITIATPTTGRGPGPASGARISPEVSPTGWVRSPATVTITGGPGTARLTYWAAPIALENGLRYAAGGEIGMTTWTGSTANVVVADDGFTVVYFYATGADGRPGPWGFTIPGVDGTAPSLTPPYVTFAYSGTLGVGAGTTQVRWLALDAYSAPLHYLVQESIGGGAYRAAGTTTSPVLSRRLRLGTEYRYRVKAIDSLGNGTGWVAGPTYRVSTIDSGTAGMTLSGTWRTAWSATAIGGGTVWSAVPGASASVSFTGSGIALVASTGAGRGTAEVLLDGRVYTTVSLSTPTATSRLVWSASWRTAARHTVAVRVPRGTTGTTRVEIDGFLVIEPRPTSAVARTSIEAETATRTLTGAVRPATVATMTPGSGGAWSGGRQLVWPGAPSGTLILTLPIAPETRAPEVGRARVTVYATKGPDYGRVDLSIAGRSLVRRVNLYSPIVVPSGPIDLGLIDARVVARLVVKVTGRDVASSGYLVGLDRIILTPE